MLEVKDAFFFCTYKDGMILIYTVLLCNQLMGCYLILFKMPQLPAVSALLLYVNVKWKLRTEKNVKVMSGKEWNLVCGVRE